MGTNSSAILITAIILSVLFYLVRRFKGAEYDAFIKKWTKEKKENPEEFLADDDLVFVEYKGKLFPMTALEKKERWDTWNRDQKREFFNTMTQLVKKGRVKVNYIEGKPMYSQTGKGKEYSKILWDKTKEYLEKSKRGRKFSN